MPLHGGGLAPSAMDFVLEDQPSPDSVPKIDFGAQLNSEQYAAVTAEPGPLLVLAGAGSGKTRTLTYRVAWLLSKDVRPGEILLLTFTNKAAKEMLYRVEELTGIEPRRFWRDLPLDRPPGAQDVRGCRRPFQELHDPGRRGGRAPAKASRRVPGQGLLQGQDAPQARAALLDHLARAQHPAGGRGDGGEVLPALLRNFRPAPGVRGGL